MKIKVGDKVWWNNPKFLVSIYYDAKEISKEGHIFQEHHFKYDEPVFKIQTISSELFRELFI